jgi:hypothetical protein
VVAVVAVEEEEQSMHHYHLHRGAVRAPLGFENEWVAGVACSQMKEQEVFVEGRGEVQRWKLV